VEPRARPLRLAKRREDHRSFASSVPSSSPSHSRFTFFENQQRRGLGERFLLPRELTLERTNAFGYRQRGTPLFC
jgi:hypothetical protein